MKTMQFRKHVGTDGVLTLHVPTDVANVDLDVLVVVSEASKPVEALPPHNWAEFVARTSGSIPDPRFVRPPQGNYETRDALG